MKLFITVAAYKPALLLIGWAL